MGARLHRRRTSYQSSGQIGRGDRYRRTVLHVIRRVVRAVPTLVVVAILLASCSGGGGGKKSAAAAPCPLFQRLDEIVASVSHADVSDPEASKRTLDEGVQNYAAALQSLRNVVPVTLQGDVDRVEAAVHQYRFQDAAAARGALDAYAATTCGRRAAPVSSTTTTPVTAEPTTDTTTGVSSTSGNG